MIRIEPIPEWRKALRMLSVQANFINTAGLTAWATLGDLREKIPAEIVVVFAVAMLVLGTAGRLVKQRGVRQPKATPQTEELPPAAAHSSLTTPRESEK